MSITVAQLLPRLDYGGVERGTVEIARALKARGDEAVVISAGGRLVPELEALGALHVALDIGSKRLTTLGRVGRLRDVLRSLRVDVVHARSRLPAWLAWLALRSLPAAQRPRFVMGCHGPYTPNGYSAIVSRGERVIAISESIRDYLFAHYPDLDRKRVVLVPRGVDFGEWPYGYRPHPDWCQRELAGLRLPHPGLLLVLVGRLTRWKGHQDFITIVAGLRQQGVPATGLIIGGAEPRKADFLDELRQTITSQGLASHVHLMGARSDVREWMASADVVVSLTREPEAFGRTSIEALALGRPVVGYAHGGTREVLRDCFPDGICRVGDTGEVLARLAHYWRRPPHVPPLSRYSLAAMQAGELAVYDDLLRPPT